MSEIWRNLKLQPQETCPIGFAFSVLSMGWGVQTWTLAAMMALGEFPRSDFIVFADTRHESRETYDFIRQWQPWLEEHGLIVVTVRGKRTDVPEGKSIMIPAFAKGDKAGVLRRQCTHDWKIMPVRRFIRRELEWRGVKVGPGIVETWMGISLDEWHRMKDSDVEYITHRYPLVDRRLRRADCVSWLESNGLPVPPKSSCVICPYQSQERWRSLKARGGADWNKAVETDERIRRNYREQGKSAEIYLHRARLPLPEALGLEYADPDPTCDSGYCFV